MNQKNKVIKAAAELIELLATLESNDQSQRTAVSQKMEELSLEMEKLDEDIHEIDYQYSLNGEHQKCQ